MAEITGTQVVSSSSVLSSGLTNPGALTPDGLMLYMQTRLGGIDSQIDALFHKQQQIEEMRKHLTEISKHFDSEEGVTLKSDDVKEIWAEVDALETLDPEFAGQLRQELKDGGVPPSYWGPDGQLMPDLPLTAEQTKGLKDSIDTRVKALESSSQLEMIQLQSLMSARQAAVSMCTNLVSALGKADEAIANNIGH